MTAKGNTLTCAKCGASVRQNEYGQLQGGRFDKVTDWYAWQTQCVADEVSRADYSLTADFRAEKLVGKKYVDMGEAAVTHDAYTLSFDNDYLYLPAPEAVYRFKRLEKLGCTTKFNLAVERQTELLQNN